MTKFNTDKLRKIAEPRKLSRAEEMALEAYPIRIDSTACDCDINEGARGIYQFGYEQAEKDLALTWEDMKTIFQIIATSDWYDFEINGKLWSKEFYEEVLKRYLEAKK